MFKLTGVLKKIGLGGSVALSVATFAWSYLGGVRAVEYGFTTTALLLKKAAISAGVAGVAGLAASAALALGLWYFQDKLRLGKKKFISW